MSSTKHLLDPELRAMADGPFLQDLDDAKVARVRKVMAEQTPALSDPKARGLYRKEVFVPQNNAPDCAVSCTARTQYQRSPSRALTCTYMVAATFSVVPRARTL